MSIFLLQAENGSVSQYLERPVWAFENPVKINFGKGTFDSVPEIINGRPYCLVTYNEPYFDTLTASLSAIAGPPTILINNITPNPDFTTLAESCRQFSKIAKEDCVIVALGGGSVMDAAKVLASTNDGFEPIRRFLETGEGEDQLSSHPIIAVPTTAGTGSEVTHWATVWDMEAM
ncbi:MAG: iron-containing alcohol dehydrogenase, partial [Sneathiella sp.]|nr:iron-containing alcohol dehydrogenase [Sneathiella sp.]